MYDDFDEFGALELYEEHEFRRLLRYYGIPQETIAKKLGISKSYLNLQLAGERPLQETVEEYLTELIHFLKHKKRKPIPPFFKHRKAGVIYRDQFNNII